MATFLRSGQIRTRVCKHFNPNTIVVHVHRLLSLQHPAIRHSSLTDPRPGRRSRYPEHLSLMASLYSLIAEPGATHGAMGGAFSRHPLAALVADAALMLPPIRYHAAVLLLPMALRKALTRWWCTDGLSSTTAAGAIGPTFTYMYIGSQLHTAHGSTRGHAR